MAGPLTVQNLLVFYQRCPSGNCAGLYQTSSSATISNCATDYFRYTDYFDYQNGTASVPVTITWLGNYQDGTPYSATRSDTVPPGSGSRDFSNSPTYDDSNVMAHLGPMGTIHFQVTWTNPDGTAGNATSPTFTYHCG